MAVLSGACGVCCEGMDYLHNSFVGPHGHLTSRSCVVDSRYTCKITDYGVNWLRDRYKEPETDEEDAMGNNSWQTLIIPSNAQYTLHIAESPTRRNCFVASASAVFATSS